MSEVTIDRLESAMRTVASLIHQSGGKFWPVFERLEAERNILVSRQSRLSFYLSTDHSVDDSQGEIPSPAFRSEDFSGDQPQRNRLH